MLILSAARNLGWERRIFWARMDWVEIDEAEREEREVDICLRSTFFAAFRSTLVVIV